MKSMTLNRGQSMRSTFRSQILTAAMLLTASGCGEPPTTDDTTPDAGQQPVSAVSRFVSLPENVRYPEGLAADPETGSIYVATFDFYGPSEHYPNKLLRYDSDGKLLDQRDFGGTPMLGITLNPRDGKIYIANFGESKIQRISKNFSATTPIEDVTTVPRIGAPGERIVQNPDGTEDRITFGNEFSAPNVIIFDDKGDLLFSDSFQGAVFRVASPDTCAAPCTATLVKQDPLLATAGFPAFGANGLAFTKDGSGLLICNTGDDRLLTLDLASNSLQITSESIDGCDGLARDPQGRLWAAANQGDRMMQLDDRGRVVSVIGEFEGIDADGAPKGLLFPTNIAFLGNDMYVANLAQYYTTAEGDEPEEDVKVHTISRIALPAATE